MQSIRRLTLSAALALVVLPAGVLGAQETTIRGFTDVTYGASNERDSRSAFALGQFDLYISSKLADHLSFLGESVFEYDDANRDFVVDVERVVITYDASHFLRVSAGKHHTPLGYWNTAYHHGALMQPTIDRPLLVRFEDDGGILPIHTIGALVSGRDISPLHLGYDVMVGNGIGGSPTSDGNNAKSLTMAVSSDVTSALKIGANLYVDHAPIGSPAVGVIDATLPSAQLLAPLSQRIVGGYGAYLGAHVETIAEYQRVIDRFDGGPSHDTDGYFVYGGYRIGKLVPYAVYEQLAFPGDDPYFQLADVRQTIGGARYDVASAASLKLEARRRRVAAERSVTEFAVQAAIGF